MKRDIEWTDAALEDMAALEKGMGQRVQKAVERFVESGAGNIKKLQGIDPPEYRLRVGDYRVRFNSREEAIVILRVLHRKEAYR